MNRGVHQLDDRRREATAGWLGLGVALLLAAPVSCTTARPLAPLAAGQWAVEASLPMLWVGNSDFDFPVGNVTLGGRYGIDSTHEVRFRFHPAALVATGIVGVEGGGVWHVRPAHGWSPALHLTGDLSVFTHPASYDRGLSRAVRGAVDLAAIAHVEPLAWLWPYIVLDSPVVLASGEWAPSAIVGVQLRPGEHWELSVETGWADFTEDASRLTQPYVSPFGRGALWMALAVGYRIGQASPAREAP